MIQDTKIQKILPLILKSRSKNIVITTHHKPDGDAMGSTLALYNFFLAIGVKSTVITPTDYADFLSWMPGNDNVIIYENEVEKSNTLVSEADFIFCLDFNKVSRINEMGAEVEKSKAHKILMDHHQEPQMFDDMTWWDSKACSTCELIYRFIVAEGFQEKINKEIAQCIYTGIMTDTGSFRHRGTNANTHKIAADLLEKGIDQTEIHQKVFDSFTENRLRLIGFALSERMEVLKEFNTVLIHLTKDDLKRFDIRTGDTEGLVNYGLGINGTKLAALIIDRDVLVKMSFRSVGDFNVNEFARDHFNGGGHINAAGGSSTDTIEATILKFKELLKEYKNQLQ